jgi:hypothetical protein
MANKKHGPEQAVAKPKPPLFQFVRIKILSGARIAPDGA